MQNQAQDLKLLCEEAREIVRNCIKNSKFIETENNTGYSYFQGKSRLLKILKSKKNLTIEINVNLPENIENLYNLDKISYAQAHKKHLGTLKYYLKTDTIQNIQSIVNNMLESFEKEELSKNSDNSEN